MWHLLISIKFYVYSVLIAHILALFYMFPWAMFYLSCHLIACSIIATYISLKVQMDEVMDYYMHNEIDLKLKASGYYLT